MGKLFDELLPEHEEFIKKQKIFFVGSAPLSDKGHVNISPKGYDVLKILSSTEVTYLDLTGSGNETSAHINENKRITFMFIAFEGPPMILRLYGQGRTILPNDTEWDEFIKYFPTIPGARQILHAKITSVKTSCGFSVPFLSYEGDRETLTKWAEKQGEEKLQTYWKEKNYYSMDGLITPIGQSELKK
ncbi:pyridoxamine 5'-phosphate oxidase family protein [Bacillus sp. 03113]|uniref:pyridoxamine 5'-phosphate oxidase family protein n=1 Tax=Bacillus sp. 03113 TaxID=2578211 RepID=UPI00114150DC|nr:pyridoxamine 5'-phosphate oxidase family protein [Bacillus sp. 03113]